VTVTTLSVAVTAFAVVQRLSRLRRPELPVSPVCVAFNAVRDESDDVSMNNNGFAPQSAGISPALLNSFQNPHQQQQKPFPGTLNPSQLINGAGPIQQLGGSINPAALQQHQQQSPFNLPHLLNTFGISRDHFQALSQQDKQNLGQKYIQMLNQQLNQGQMMQPQVGQQVPYERPSSSASNHGPHQNSMLPPPPPRPPTAQGAPQISRPGTSLSHRSPTIPGSGPSSLGAMMERPQSGLVRFFFQLSFFLKCTLLRRLIMMVSSSKGKINPHSRLNRRPFQALPTSIPNRLVSESQVCLTWACLASTT